MQAGTVNGHTHNGDIMTDFGLSVSGDEDKTVTGKIGAGGQKIELSSNEGDVHIKRGPAFPATPPPPATAEAARPGPRAHARHLKHSSAARAAGHAVTAAVRRQLSVVSCSCQLSVVSSQFTVHSSQFIVRQLSVHSS